MTRVPLTDPIENLGECPLSILEPANSDCRQTNVVMPPRVGRRRQCGIVKRGMRRLVQLVGKGDLPVVA